MLVSILRALRSRGSLPLAPLAAVALAACQDVNTPSAPAVDAQLSPGCPGLCQVAPAKILFARYVDHRSMIARVNPDGTGLTFLAASVVLHNEPHSVLAVIAVGQLAYLVSGVLRGSEVTSSWNARNSASVSATGRPFTASVIRDADAFEIAQPCPSKPTSRTTPSASVTCTERRSPHSGLLPSAWRFASGGEPWFRGRLLWSRITD